MKINKLIYKDNVVGVKGFSLEIRGCNYKIHYLEWALLTSIKLICRKAYG